MQLRMHDAAMDELLKRKRFIKVDCRMAFLNVQQSALQNILYMRIPSIDVTKKLPMKFRSRAFAIFRRHSSLHMTHDNKQRERESLLDVLSRIVKARRRSKSFVYCKIRSQDTTMTPEKDDGCDLSDVILQENSDIETQVYAVH